MNFEPAATASSNCSALRIVPAPTSASGTSPATRRIASSPAEVRNVISIAGSPPATSARAIGTASLASSITITGITGCPVMMGRSACVFCDMDRSSLEIASAFKSV